MRVLLVKELRECSRDGRARLVGGMIGLLVAVSLIAGWSTHAEQRRQARPT
jgi:hypothetical protein